MRKVAATSTITYHEIIKGDKENTENVKVLRAISQIQPCTGRMIYHHLNKSIENSAIARCLNNLKKLKLVQVLDGDRKCKVSGRPAQHYQVFKVEKQLSIF